MSETNNSDDAGEIHTGYDLETGLLARMREWTDLFPWLRLARTLRVTGSPVMVGMVAITFIFWWLVQNSIIADSGGVKGIGYRVSLDVVQAVVFRAGDLNPVSVFLMHMAKVDLGTSLLTIVWSLLAWMPVVLYLTRQGALLTAGRDLVGVERGVRRSIALTPVGWLIAVVPLACVLVFALMIMVAGWMHRAIDGVAFLEVPLALIVALIAIPCGLLGFGAYVAVPLGWSALANEQDSDALDSLSRGYEYLYRRPLKVVLYAFLGSLLLLVITAITTSIAQVGSWVIIAMFAAVGTDIEFTQQVVDLLKYYPTIVATTLLWALVGGSYLLLRFDAGEQEVEDIWQPPPKPKPLLPQLSQSTGTA